MNKTKLYKNLNFIFKWSLLSVVLWFLTKELATFNLAQLTVPFSSTTSIALLVLTFFLMPFNWGIETAKWKMLIKSTQSLSWFAAIQSVVCGVAVSLFTPNRIGDVGGRLVYIPFSERKSAIWVNLLCSATQWVTTIIVGILALLFIFSLGGEAVEGVSFFGLIFISSIAVLVLAVLFNRRFTLLGRLRRFSWFKKYLDDFSKIKQLQKQQLFLALIYSFVRYGIFTVQYWLLLVFFNVELPAVFAFPLIALVFLINTLIPAGILLSLGIRGSAAVALFGIWSNNTEGILAATMTLWVINLLLPAVIGSLVIPKFNLFPIPYRK